MFTYDLVEVLTKIQSEYDLENASERSGSAAACRPLEQAVSFRFLSAQLGAHEDVYATIR